MPRRRVRCWLGAGEQHMAWSCEPPLDTEGSSQAQPAGRQTASRCSKEPNPTNTPKGWEASSPLSLQMRAPSHQHPKQKPVELPRFLALRAAI